jgi:glycosyltransferase involved in cell wall biosynthesis
MIQKNCKVTDRYALVTAAYNEELYIETLIRSVIAQTIRPELWVIVSDGSTDCTDQIVSDFARGYPFIKLHRITEDHARNFVAQVHAINAGLQRLRTYPFEFVGNLDADISLQPSYFSELLTRFQNDPVLGLAGGYICEQHRGVFQPRSTNSPLSVAHAVQLFRHQCLKEIGGEYAPMPYGGPDWYAEVTARRRGWKVRAFPELRVHHHRPTGTATGLLKTAYREGLMDHSFGSHPFYEVFRTARRLTQKPYGIGAAVRLSAFAAATIKRAPRPVPQDFVTFLRDHEIATLKQRLLVFRTLKVVASQSSR